MSTYWVKGTVKCKIWTKKVVLKPFSWQFNDFDIFWVMLLWLVSGQIQAEIWSREVVGLRKGSDGVNLCRSQIVDLLVGVIMMYLGSLGCFQFGFWWIYDFWRDLFCPNEISDLLNMMGSLTGSRGNLCSCRRMLRGFGKIEILHFPPIQLLLMIFTGVFWNIFSWGETFSWKNTVLRAIVPSLSLSRAQIRKQASN
jgi:hypothetical protein